MYARNVLLNLKAKLLGVIGFNCSGEKIGSQKIDYRRRSGQI